MEKHCVCVCACVCSMYAAQQGPTGTCCADRRFPLAWAHTTHTHTHSLSLSLSFSLSLFIRRLILHTQRMILILQSMQIDVM